MPRISCKIQILSYKARDNDRVESLQTLLKWLLEQGVRQSDTFIFIVAPERRKYKADFAAFTGINFVSGVVGVAKQKVFAQDWMQNRFGDDELVLHFDDDTMCLKRASAADSKIHVDSSPCGLCGP